MGFEMRPHQAARNTEEDLNLAKGRYAQVSVRQRKCLGPQVAVSGNQSDLHFP